MLKIILKSYIIVVFVKFVWQENLINYACTHILMTAENNRRQDELHYYFLQLLVHIHTLLLRFWMSNNQFGKHTDEAASSVCFPKWLLGKFSGKCIHDLPTLYTDDEAVAKATWERIRYDIGLKLSPKINIILI